VGMWAVSIFNCDVQLKHLIYVMSRTDEQSFILLELLLVNNVCRLMVCVSCVGTHSSVALLCCQLPWLCFSNGSVCICESVLADAVTYVAVDGIVLVKNQSGRALVSCPNTNQSLKWVWHILKSCCKRTRDLCIFLRLSSML